MSLVLMVYSPISLIVFFAQLYPPSIIEQKETAEKNSTKVIGEYTTKTKVTNLKTP